ncbi:MAG: DEAD/DEAH box helicase [Desulfuromonas sp.]|nr:DEAD/DEAH box helicase [Desulfuromonas sp.]
MMIDELTKADIRRACGNTYYQRGLQYFRQGRVLDFEYDEVEHCIHATVSGSRRHVYKQVIGLSRERAGIAIDGDCSCPMDYNCKHVAAVMLEVLEELGGNESFAPVLQRKEVDIFQQWKQQAELQLYEELHSYQATGLSESLLYVISEQPYGHRTQWVCKTFKCRRLKSGGWGKPSSYGLQNSNSWYGYPAWIAPVDKDIVSLLGLHTPSGNFLQIKGDSGLLALQKMIATGRCFYGEISTEPLRIGPPRKGALNWQAVEGEQRQLSLQIDGLDDNCAVLPTDPPWYLDISGNESGLIEQPLPGSVLRSLQQLPLVDKTQLHEASLTLTRMFPQQQIPLPVELNIRPAAKEAVPLMRLMRVGAAGELQAHIARIRFGYAPCDCKPLLLSGENCEPELVGQDGVYWRVEQDAEAEARYLKQLGDYGMCNARFAGVPFSGELDLLFSGDSVEQSVAGWKQFLDQLPQLEEQGWRIEIDDSFSMQFTTPDSIDFQLDNGSGDWFEMGLDLEHNGQKLPLLPLLTRWLEQGDTGQPLLVQLDDGSWLHCPEAMITPVVATLVELFDGHNLNAQGQMKLHRSQAHQLVNLEQQLSDHVKHLHWHGDEQLQQLARKLNQFDGIASVVAPTGLTATLRDYQLQGLAWLQFLREYQFNGILADDMGLGKTIQTLAHLLIEKESGRMQSPVLIVAPTSVLSNWQREAQRFTPELRVQILHGPQRSDYFSRRDEFDLLITSYALLNRDAEHHQQFEYHALILDEAQAIKNPRAKAALAAASVPANHRLCLTGTPVENHLGELWSLFHFLMPGFLGPQKRFNQLFRKPIEQQGNKVRQQELQRRLLPFILRRDKQQVAKELPPKTTMVSTIELGAAQSRLYETVRSAMSKKVRKLLEQKGLKNSHIEILDALLKLRQVCCDPRLVKLSSAKNVKGSAKLERLLEMIEPLIEDGRKILLFSQFTSMLSLIEDELKARDIDYTKLTGRTRKRDEAIARFQDGDVPLFLISLKAGGTGLNLTAADTVIHYDPWWNPAVENQATDRAYRIGQDKPVFVYKMIAQGTVEEKIVQMQEKKQQLADGVYAEDGEDGKNEVSRLSGGDLLALLEG